MNAIETSLALYELMPEANHQNYVEAFRLIESIAGAVARKARRGWVAPIGRVPVANFCRNQGSNSEIVPMVWANETIAVFV